MDKVINIKADLKDMNIKQAAQSVEFDRKLQKQIAELRYGDEERNLMYELRAGWPLAENNIQILQVGETNLAS